MKVQDSIEAKLASCSPTHLEVINESSQHNVPVDSETHFRVVMVSDEFAGKRKVARHRLIYGLLRDELAGPVHALSLHVYTPQEWAGRTAPAPASPPCLGGGASGSN